MDINIIPNAITEKFELLRATASTRLEELIPVFFVIGLLVIIGGIEGNSWRRGKLYAGYYRLIFLSSGLWLLTLVACIGGWMIKWEVMPLPTLMLVVAVPSFALGWAVLAGRPVLR